MLLEDNVCINASYQSSIPPIHGTKVYIRVLEYPKIVDIDEEKRIMVVEFKKLFNVWRDERVHINMKDLDHDKLIKTHDKNGSFASSALILLLASPNLCKSLESQSILRIWTPHDQYFHIKDAIQMDGGIANNPWGIHGKGLRFTTPINESNPLIVLGMKFVVKIKCKFHYVGYPLDKEACNLRFGSKPLNPLALKLFDPDGICKNIADGYELNGFDISTSCFSNDEENYQVGFNSRIDRIITKHVLQYYLPSAMIVLISQTSFVIPLSSLPGRTGLVVTQFLALTNIFINEQVILLMTRTTFRKIE